MDLCIIIPAYNANETIGVTLDSIRNQRLPISFEVIVVNDCSDYDYNEIISKFKECFPIKELKTEKNLGPGGARQYGIDNSSSEYITFIDSDDCFYDNNSISKMYKEIVKSNADLLISDFIYKGENRTIIKKIDAAWLHGKMYKRSFLTDNNIRFNNSRSNEDNGFNRLILLLNPRIICLDEIVYVYNDNPNSITRKNNCLYEFTGIEGFCYNMNWAMDEALLRGKTGQDIILLALDVLMSLYIYYLGLEKKYDVSKILEWGKEIKEKYNEYQMLLNKEIKLEILEKKKEFLKDEFVIENYYISFEEFLDKI